MTNLPVAVSSSLQRKAASDVASCADARAARVKTQRRAPVQHARIFIRSEQCRRGEYQTSTSVRLPSVVMKYKHLPLAGVALSLALFVFAASRYPGGTLQSSNSVGY